MSNGKAQGLQKRYITPQQPSTTRARIDAMLEEANLEEESGEKNIVEKIEGVKKNPELFDVGQIKTFDPTTIHKNAFILMIASRRSGKTHLIQHILEEYSKKNKIDAVFLFTKTNAGFENSIPQTYRFRSLDRLQEIIDMQIKVKKHNRKAKKKDRVKSNIVVLLDDFLGSGGLRGDMRTNSLLNKLAVNGRHASFGDDSNLMVIMLSQIFVGVSPQIRLNADYIFTTKLSSRKERENIATGFLSLNSGVKGLHQSYSVFDSVVNENDFQFLCIDCSQQNKKKFSDFVYKIKAPAKLKDIHLVGDDDDWRHNTLDIYF